MLPEEQKRTYRAFYDSARNNDILDTKTTLLSGRINVKILIISA